MTEARAERERGGKRAPPTAWISHGFEELVASRDAEPNPGHIDFDVVIVGSGYGGAIAAARLAGATKGKDDKVKVCVLERGREYPGMFPPRMTDLAGHVRFSTDGATCARGEREGLFDVRVGADVSALVANGLGGGSLINAGVMAEPADEVWTRPEWPAAIRGESADVRRDRFTEMRLLLGAALRDGKINPADGKREVVDNTVERDQKSIPKKFEVLQRMAKQSNRPKQFRAAPITVALTEKRVSSAGVRLVNCLRCGDCATGCNHGAKDSLDVNLLRTASSGALRLHRSHEPPGSCRGAPPNRQRRRVRPRRDPRWLTPMPICAPAGVFKLVAQRPLRNLRLDGSLPARADDLFQPRSAARPSGDDPVAYDQKDRPARAAVVVNAIERRPTAQRTRSSRRSPASSTCAAAPKKRSSSRKWLCRARCAACSRRS
jgi:choline dehydrogenase-like flavoprotein